MPQPKGPQWPSFGRSGGAAPPALQAGLAQADALIQRRQWLKARQILDPLAEQFPKSPAPLERLLNIMADQHDWAGYLRTAERLAQLVPDEPLVGLALGNAYALNGRPALAVRQYQRFMARWPAHEEAPALRLKVAELIELLSPAREELGVQDDDWLDLVVMHEEVQVATERGDFDQSIAVGERLLRRLPNMTPLLNNLSLVYFSTGKLERGIELARRTLALDPQNPHALSNLTRYLFLSGRLDEADAMAGQLRALDAPLVDVAVKQAESLSILGDDAGVLAAWRRVARAADWKANPFASSMLCHLAAVATMRQGDLPGARRLWNQALGYNPGFDVVRANLEDLKRPAAERNAPWPLPMNMWVSREQIDELIKDTQKVKRGNSAAAPLALNRAIERRPMLLTLIPALLDRGDPIGREFATITACGTSLPTLLAALRDFALGQRGPDNLRMQAAQTALSEGLLPAGALRFWLKGAWSEVMMVGFEISGEPTPREVPRRAQDLFEQAGAALNVGDTARSERLLLKALELAPDDSAMLNNLAATYSRQNRFAEARALTERIFAQDPDYLFGRTSMALIRIGDGLVDEADALLRPLLSRRRLHYSELAALMHAEIELDLARGNPDAARAWLDMWQRADPENPGVAQLRARIDGARRPGRGKRK